MKLSLIVAEAALELVPSALQRSPAVMSDARRREVDPSRILLDRSFHHSAMLKLQDGFKRGRPDLVHSLLLSVSSTPLYLDGFVKVYVHTYGGQVLEIAEKTRLPKSYLRFRGLVEGSLSDDVSAGLILVYKADMKQLVKKTNADFVVGLSTQGKMMSMKELSSTLVSKRSPCAVIGGFPHGHFTAETLAVIDELVRIHAKPLDAHVAASRLIYEIENRLEELTND